MAKINWGIIGCGDVTEVKSGPAFNKVKNSSLVAVMRRNAGKAKDYAQRHNVSKWYSDADQLINDPDVNAIYIATPPASHEMYAIAAINAGKPVYVEKPMTTNYASAQKMMNAAKEANIKMCVAHYRRAQPYFKKIKQLINEKAIGEIRFANLTFYKKLFTEEDLKAPGNAWRVDAEIAGGGLFHDLGTHQLDLMYFFFGGFSKVSGMVLNQSKLYDTPDFVTGNIVFNNGVAFNGVWSFNVGEHSEKDCCEIIGSHGKIIFSVFGKQNITLERNGKTEIISFEPLQHVQQPMIEKVVEYFLDEGPNPSSAEDGAFVMQMIDQITRS